MKCSEVQASDMNIQAWVILKMVMEGKQLLILTENGYKQNCRYDGWKENYAENEKDSDPPADFVVCVIWHLVW